MTHGSKAVAANPGAPHTKYYGVFFSTFLPATFAIIYAIFLTSLPVHGFVDRDNYIEYTYISDIILIRNQMAGWSTVFSNEPLWLLMNIGLSRFFNPDDVVRIFVFAPSLAASFTILRHSKKNIIFLIIFLFFPLFLKNYIIHLRQGVAISIFIYAYYSNNRPIRLILLSLTPFIHSSFFFVLMILAMSYSFNKINVSSHVKMAIFALFFIILGLTINLISSGLGARQGTEYLDAAIDVSGFAFLFWAAIFIVFLSSGEDFLKLHLFEVSSLAFYLCTYFTTVVSGRIFESSIITILLAGISLTGTRKHLFLLTTLTFMMSDYAMRYSQPAFGWGVV